MKSLLLLLGAVVVLFGVTDAAGVSGYMNFYYDPPSQYFILTITSKCYITPLSREEKDHVHSRQGIEDLELTYVREWLGVLNETLIYHSDPNLPQKVHDSCRDKDIFFINRVLPTASSGSSIIG